MISHIHAIRSNNRHRIHVNRLPLHDGQEHDQVVFHRLGSEDEMARRTNASRLYDDQTALCSQLASPTASRTRRYNSADEFDNEELQNVLDDIVNNTLMILEGYYKKQQE
ncbi:predicted protein [Chaetoceros tenuissimus]|uniref:Uncharacterized protein n=1 Tax=Chaetoceros tenuissimus TaxID=426638 RepID=A0AAD3D2G1_9STRA|nr:predicted protein [Chaetoceros tenuissimus]